MASAYVEVVLGVSLGGIVGVLPAVAAAIVGGIEPSLAERRFAREHIAGVSLPIAGLLAVSVGGLAIEPGQFPRMIAAGCVVALLTLFGFEQGTRLGSALRRDSTRPIERGRPLGDVAVDAIDASGQVTICPQGAIRTVSGYPKLPADLRESIAAERWRLPADLPLSELETRIEHQLRTTYDLEVADVTVDARGTASVAAATPTAGIARRIPDGHRAMSISSRVPGEIEPGEDILILATDSTIEGRVLASGPSDGQRPALPISADGGQAHVRRTEIADLGTNGSRGRARLTVAVPTDAVAVLLKAEFVTVAVRSTDSRPDFRALSLFDQTAASVRITTMDEELKASLGGSRTDVDVFAATPPSETAVGWTFDPSLMDIVPGSTVVLVGSATRLGELVTSSSPHEVGAT